MWHILKWWPGRPRSFLLLLLSCTFAFTLYYISGYDHDYKNFQYTAWRSYARQSYAYEVVGGHLVYNEKCHMLSMNPYDSSIRRFVKKEKIEACSFEPRLSSISRKSNGSIYLVIDNNAAKHYKNLSCCWASIIRPKVSIEHSNKFDSKISVKSCQDFQHQVVLKKDVEAILVTCYKSKAKKQKKSIEVVYENVHAIVNPERIKQRMNNATSMLSKNSRTMKDQKALSVLMLGIDSVSRLNFYRTMPLTRMYFEKRGWTEFRAYNKMGDNTFPNLMAILSGQNETTVKKCFEKKPHTMDNCSIIWHNFRNAGYATAYAEDQSWISTFNYAMDGFVKPPTDYYFRPYIIASEKLLEARSGSNARYCTGPEFSVDRVFDAAVDFSKAFINSSYFGFFWTNSMSHDNVNGPSAYDAIFLDKLQNMEDYGVMDDSVIVVFSDHGMRYGDIRDTFVGWYEERLPFIYMWVPKWFRKRNPDINEALRSNQNRLTSPYDLYETLRDILQRAGGQALASSGCPLCSSLFKPVPCERGCKDAGIAPHWCTCAGFEPYKMDDPIVTEGAQRFIDYMNNVTDQYKTKTGSRLCSKLVLKRIIRVKRLIDLDEDPYGKALKLFYLLEVKPGGGKFETTISYNGSGKYTIREQEVSRINLYIHNAKCLEKGNKKYCQCSSFINDNILTWL